MREGWSYKKLGDLCDIISGRNQKDVESVDGAYPIYGSGGIMGHATAFLCEAGTTIVGRKGTINKPLYVSERFWNVDTAFGLQPKDTTDSKFLFYLCKSIDFTKYDKSVTIPSLVKKDLLKIDVCCPPLTPQQQIVSELDLLSHILDQKRQQLKEYDALAESIFYDMFGDPVENPKGWEVKKLGDLCNISSSKRIFANEYVDEGIPFYRGKEVTEKSKGLDPTLELFISRDRYTQIKESFGVPKVGDILITAVGTIGNIWVVDNDDPFYFKDGNIIWLSQISNIDPIYFRKVLEILISAFKLEMSNGCAYSALTIVNLKKMGANLPPLTLQRSFAAKIESIEHQKQLLRASIKETAMLFQSRMDYWFNG